MFDMFDKLDKLHKPDNSWERLKETGNSYFREKKYEEALKYYNKAIEINNGIEVLHSNKGTCEKCLQNYKEAELEYIKAIKLNPDNAKNYNRLASIYLIMGELSEAYSVQKKALKLDQFTLAYKEQLETINQMINEEEQINALLKQNKVDEIEKKYKELIAKWPEFIYLKKQYILFLFNIIKYKEAAVFLYELFTTDKIKKNNKDFAYLACLSLYYNGEYKTAEDVVLTLLKEIPDKKLEDLLYRIRNIELIKKKGNDLYEQKNYQEAIKEYTKALELDPTNKKYNSIILVNRALCFQKIEKYNSAINDATQSIKINPNYARAYVKRANVFLKLKNFKAAMEDFDKAKKIDPSSPGIENYLQDLDKKCVDLEYDLKLEKGKKQKLYQEIISLKNMINVKKSEINDKDDIINDLKNKIKDLQKVIANSYENSKVMGLMEKLVTKEESLKKMESEIKEMKSRYPFELLEGEKLMTVNIICLDQNITHSIICKNTHKFIYIENILYEIYPELADSENYFIAGGEKINKYKTLDENKIKDNEIINLQKFDKDDENENISLKKSFISKDSFVSQNSFISKDSIGSEIPFGNLFMNLNKDNNSQNNNNNNNNNEKIYYNPNSIDN